MRLRQYIPALDFDRIKTWITDERTHAMWCAYRFSFPLSREDFDNVLREHAEKYGDCSFVATTDSGEAIGFFCLSTDTAANLSMLRFVVISPELRGHGTGFEMIVLALRYAFGFAKTERVKLCVFAQNTAARRCYEKVGFTETSTDKGAFSYKDETWDRCNMEVLK